MSPFLLVLAVAGAVAAGDVPPLAERALERLGAISLDGWAYTETTLEDGTTRVVRHDPSEPPERRSRLVSIDGRAPTEKEIKAWARAHPPREADESGDDQVSLKSSLDASSLTLLEETPSRAIYAFRAQAEDDDGESMTEHLAGRLTVIKEDEPWVSEMSMRLEEPVSQLGAKITEMTTVLTYRKLASNGPIVPDAVHVTVRGRVLLVKRLDEESRVTFSDFVKVTAP